MKNPPDKIKEKQSLEEVDRLNKYLDGIKIYKVNKCSLKNIVADDIVIEGIRDAVTRTHQIVTRALHFLKLYILHKKESFAPLGPLDNCIELIGALQNTRQSLIALCCNTALIFLNKLSNKIYWRFAPIYFIKGWGYRGNRKRGTLSPLASWGLRPLA